MKKNFFSPKSISNKNIRVITFDIDDTLIDLEETINLALEKALNRAKKLAPEKAHLLSTSYFISCRNKIVAQFKNTPMKLEEIRFLSFKEALKQVGVEDEMIVKIIHDTFMQSRREDIKLYDDTLFCIDTLKKGGYILGLVSDGNTDHFNSNSLFNFKIFSEEYGVKKPDPYIFNLISQKAECYNYEILHIGNSLQEDIAGANNADCKSVWLNRKGVKNDTNIIPDVEIRSLLEIPTILKEFNPKEETIPIRFLVTIPRSGSTLLMQLLAEIPTNAVTSRLVFMGNSPKNYFQQTSKTGFTPDYSIFTNPTHHTIYQQAKTCGKQLIINKEEVGNNKQNALREDSNVNECNYKIFPSQIALVSTKPIFLFRDPLRTFDSWKKLGWADIESFILAYENVYNTYKKSKEICSATFCFTYEYFVTNRANQEIIFKKLCAVWKMPYSENIFDIKSEFASNFFFQTDREKEIYTRKNPAGVFDNVKNLPNIESNIKAHGLINEEEKILLNKQLMPIYENINNDMKQFLLSCYKGISLKMGNRLNN